MHGNDDSDTTFARYAMFLAQAEMGVSDKTTGLNNDEFNDIQEKCKHDPALAEYINFLKKSYLELYHDLDQSEIGNITLEPFIKPKYTTTRKVTNKIQPILSWARMPALVTAALVVFVLVAYLVVNRTELPYENYLNFELVLARGNLDDSLELAKYYINQNSNRRAIKILRGIQAGNNDDQTQFWISYCLGLAFLKSARKSYLDLYTTYHAAEIDSSFHYLQTISQNSIHQPSLNKDVLWYLSINRMINFLIHSRETDYNAAMKYLELCLQESGSDSVKIYAAMDDLKQHVPNKQ